MMALAYLAILCRHGADAPRFKKADAGGDGAVKGQPPEDLIALTVAEIRKLLWQLARHVTPRLTAVIQWSLWRRRHQATARACYYKHRAAAIDLQLLYFVTHVGCLIIAQKCQLICRFPLTR